MSLLNGLPNRRQFLERSALGAGGVLFLPGLLASCTDHIIPTPDTPIKVGDDEDGDWSDDTKTVVVTALSAIPEVGELLAALVEILWPKSVSVWDQIKDRVQALVEQKIADEDYHIVSLHLESLKNEIQDYLDAVQDKGDIKTAWNFVKFELDGALPYFQDPKYTVLVLPLFAQFANLYLAVLRDAVISGKEWGMNNAEHERQKANLKTAISDFKKYARDTYDSYRSTLVSNTATNNAACEPFLTINKFDREMTLTVLDFVPNWDYFDAAQFPDGGILTLPREIYSDPYGTCKESGILNLPKVQPTQSPSKIVISRVVGSPIFRAIQVTYPAGTGPNGATQTLEMGAQIYVQDRTYTDSVTNISPANPITKARVYIRFYQETLPPGLGGGTATIIQGVEAMEFSFKDNTGTGLIGGTNGDGQNLDSGWLSYPNHILSSIWVNGSLLVDHGSFSNYYAADSVVFGFRYPTGMPPVSLRTLRSFYITSPRERSAAEFAKAYSVYGISEAMITDELKAARQAHWASVKARPR